MSEMDPANPPDETVPQEKARIPFERPDGSVHVEEVDHEEATEIAKETNKGASY
jgi:hypothetical protein